MNGSFGGTGVKQLFSTLDPMLLETMATTSTASMLAAEVGESIPPDTAHVSLSDSLH